MNRKEVIVGWIRIFIGLTIFSFGVHLIIRADLGLAPWDCLGMGIAEKTPLNYGLSMTFTAILCLIVDIFMKEKIGFGTIIDALYTGNCIQLFNDLDHFPETANVFIGILIIIIGLIIMAIGQFFYMSAAQCCGPRDALLVGLGKRLSFLPIGGVLVIIYGTVLLIGWLMGGPVGIGTIVTTFGSGIVVQIVFNFLKFEPRDVDHQSVFQTVKNLSKT